MKALANIIGSLLLFAPALLQAQTSASAQGSQPIQITRSGSRQSGRGPADFFTGSVKIEALFPTHNPSRTMGGSVTFQPGARTAWHTHHLGQVLIVTSGSGWIQQRGGPVEEMRRDDVVWIPAGVKHWHGATPDTAMTHMAIQEELDGKAVEWLEKVTDEQYQRKAEPMQTPNDSEMVAPALEKYAQGPIADLWKRPDLTPRDRSIVTLAALIARNQTIEMHHYISLALDNGVKPREISEIITHLAFYSGWANAQSAVAVAKNVFADRRIGADQLPAATPTLLPLAKEAEEKRAAGVEQQFGKVAPGIVQYTTDVLFRDLWLRPDLAPRDRSLVTVSALIASGQVAQIPYHLNRAMDHGLTQAQAGEVITHLAFYAGWPNAFSAMPVAKDVFEKRPQ